MKVDYVCRPGIGSRRFAIVIKTIEMYSLSMHSVRCNDSGMVFSDIEIDIGKHWLSTVLDAAQRSK